jgi:hypothetical protein
MKFKEPSNEEKRALKGENNVEALLYALDQRLTEKTTVILVGRASYEIGDKAFTNKLRALLGEEERIDEKTLKVFLTDDIDCFHTDAAQAIIDAAYPQSYLAKLANCYVHALNEQTLVLPVGWKERLVAAPCEFQNLQIKRLDPMDFLMCKGAAGRPKDIKFLQAFCQALNIDEGQVRKKVAETLAKPTAKLLLDTSSQKYLKMLPGRLFPPPPIPTTPPIDIS